MDVAGHKMHLYCTGRGTPTEILESGLWSDSVVWYKVQPEIAKLTRVCSYDRAGLGYSDVWLSFFILFLVHVTGVLFSCSFSSLLASEWNVLGLVESYLAAAFVYCSTQGRCRLSL